MSPLKIPIPIGLLLTASTAHAASYTKIELDLGLQPLDQPEYLCIVTTQTCPSANGDDCSATNLDELSDLLGIGPKKAIGNNETEQTWDNVPIEMDEILKKKPHLQRDVLGAMASLADHTGGSKASPSVHTPTSCDMEWKEECVGPLTIKREPLGKGSKGLYIVCGQNHQNGSETNRAAFLKLDYHNGRGAHVDSVYLDGTVASVDLGFKLPAETKVTAAVVGGHYSQLRGTSFMTQDRLLVPLIPRCRMHSVQVPPQLGSEPDEYDEYDAMLRLGGSQVGAHPAPPRSEPKNYCARRRPDWPPDPGLHECRTSLTDDGRFALQVPVRKPASARR